MHGPIKRTSTRISLILVHIVASSKQADVFYLLAANVLHISTASEKQNDRDTMGTQAVACYSV